MGKARTGARREGSTPADGAELLYLVSLFPCWSETFIVREILALRQSGIAVRIASLKTHREPLVHLDAEGLRPLVDYADWTSLLPNVLAAFIRQPRRCLAWLAVITRGMWRHPAPLFKSYATALLAFDMATRYRPCPPQRIHAHWATYPSTAAMILADLLEVPFGFTSHAHDIFLEDHLLRLKLERSDLAVTISEHNVRFIEKRLGSLPRRPHVVHCGVDSSEFVCAAAARAPGLIVAVGRLDAIKGFRYLVAASALLRDEGVAFRCVIVGEGEERASLEALVKELQLQDRVDLPGAMSQDEVRHRVGEATVFALPSVPDRHGNMDGIPVSLMEAMALGTPVVSTRVSGIPELVEHGRTGLLCDPGDSRGLADCLATLLADRQLRGNLSAAARRKVESEFDCRSEARRLVELFRGGSSAPGLPAGVSGARSASRQPCEPLPKAQALAE